MNEKRLIVSFSLRDGAVVSGPFARHPEDPRELLAEYFGAADAFLVEITDEEEHRKDNSLETLRAFCRAASVPVTAFGGIKRLEDVKKLIYAGCAAAALDLHIPSDREMLEEACIRFGREHIALLAEGIEDISPDVSEIIEKYSPLFIAGCAVEPALLNRSFPGAAVICRVEREEISTEQSRRETVSSKIREDGVKGIVIDADTWPGELVSSLREYLLLEGIQFPARLCAFRWEDFKKGSDGLVPVVIQEESTDQVLMVAYMNQEAYERTAATGRMTYYSRSRGCLWIKGETSGHYQYVRSLTADCDMDTLLARVEQIGPACHTGSHSCFFREDFRAETARKAQRAEEVLRGDYETILQRKENPVSGSYTNYLFEKGIDKMLKKLGEESTEIVIAAKNPGSTEIVYEIADYLYHLMVVMAEKEVTWDEVTAELLRRRKEDN